MVGSDSVFTLGHRFGQQPLLGRVGETMIKANKLLSGGVNQWQVRQVIVLDWYDGPREGLCELAQPASCFYFELFAERYSEAAFI